MYNYEDFESLENLEKSSYVLYIIIIGSELCESNISSMDCLAWLIQYIDSRYCDLGYYITSMNLLL